MISISYDQKKTYYIFCVYLILFLPKVFGDSVYYLLDSLVFLLMLINIFNKKYITKECIYISLLGFVMIFSSICNESLNITILYSVIKFMVVIIFTVQLVKEDFKKFIMGISNSYNILVFTNFIMVIVTKDLDVFFLGGKNALQMKLIPCIILNLVKIYMDKNNNNFSNKIFLIIAIVTLFICESSTAKVVGIFAIIILICTKICKVSEKLIMIFYSTIFIIIVLVRKVQFLNDFITIYLEKDLTFTGRTFIWDFCLNKISDSPLWGFGKGNNLIESTFNVNEAHNFILEIIINFGFLGLAIYMYILFRTIRNLYKYKILKESYILFLGIFLYFIVGLTESIAFRLELWILVGISIGASNYFKERADVDNSLYSNI